ncbi:uncharacterized protein [Mytilus edulis]|uniref:uncharacterized protein isoform X1 n=1 Tax=Mytilus edulis TaxID=6550 RepID=UPI0039EECA48
MKKHYLHVGVFIVKKMIRKLMESKFMSKEKRHIPPTVRKSKRYKRLHSVYAFQRVARVLLSINKAFWILSLPLLVVIYVFTTGHVHRETREDNTKTWLLVLCTTFVPSSHREIVYNNTRDNWKSLGSDVLPVLFLESKYTQVKRTFEDNGWVVLPVVDVMSEGFPVIKSFFSAVSRHFRSKYVGYANADILFNDDLVQTLNLMEKYRPFVEKQNEIFISGSRYDVENITTKDFSSTEKIKQIQLDHSKRHSPMGQDYFITDSYYTWDMLPPIVVGKQRIDNWILINAIEFNHTAIDSSDAITAIHQTVDLGSWTAEKWNTNLSDPKYNEHLLNDLQQDFIYFQTGNLDCLPYEFNYTVAKEVVLMKRPQVAKFCKRQHEMVEVLRLRKQKQDRKIKLELMKKKNNKNKNFEVKHKIVKRSQADIIKQNKETLKKAGIFKKYYLKRLLPNYDERD